MDLLSTSVPHLMSSQVEAQHALLKQNLAQRNTEAKQLGLACKAAASEVQEVGAVFVCDERFPSSDRLPRMNSYTYGF